MKLSDKIIKILRSEDYKYYLSDDNDLVTIMMPFIHEDDSKSDIFVQINDETKHLRMYYSDADMMKKYEKNKFYEIVMQLNALLTFGKIGVNVKNNEVIYSITHSAESKREAVAINEEQFNEYLRYLLFINMELERIIESRI